MKLNTVNVLEIINSIPHQIVSFKDNSAGNKEAEILFTKMALENGAKIIDMESCLEDGLFESDLGTYGVSLIHS